MELSRTKNCKLWLDNFTTKPSLAIPWQWERERERQRQSKKKREGEIQVVEWFWAKVFFSFWVVAIPANGGYSTTLLQNVVRWTSSVETMHDENRSKVKLSRVIIRSGSCKGFIESNLHFVLGTPAQTYSDWVCSSQNSLLAKIRLFSHK